MNKELIIKPNGTALVHETVSQERELANNTYKILQAENTIEELNDLLKNERRSNKILKSYGKTNLFILALLLIMFVDIFFLGLYEVIFVMPLIIHIGLATAIAYAILEFIRNKENIEASDMAITTYSKGLENAKARLEDLKKNSVKLTPEEVEKENICKPIKIEEENRLTKLKNTLKLRKDVLTKFKLYKKFYEAGKLKEAFSDYSDEELQIITQEIENQIRKRNLNK